MVVMKDPKTVAKNEEIKDSIKFGYKVFSELCKGGEIATFQPDNPTFRVYLEEWVKRVKIMPEAMMSTTELSAGYQIGHAYWALLKGCNRGKLPDHELLSASVGTQAKEFAVAGSLEALKAVMAEGLPEDSKEAAKMLIEVAPEGWNKALIDAGIRVASQEHAEAIASGCIEAAKKSVFLRKKVFETLAAIVNIAECDQCQWMIGGMAGEISKQEDPEYRRLLVVYSLHQMVSMRWKLPPNSIPKWGDQSKL
jgi:hypothetical protein